MKSKKMSLVALFLLGLWLPGFAQHAVSAAGGNLDGAGGSASYTVGQVVYTTNSGLTGFVIQGVQQPYEPSSEIYIGTPQTAETITKSTSDVIVQTGGKLTLGESRQVHDITVMPGGQLDLSSPLTVQGNVTFKSDNDHSFSANIGTGMTVSGTVNFVKTMDENRWYFLSFPCNVPVSAISQVGGTLGELGVDWFINYYDGESRINNLGVQTNWKDYLGATLIANQGYIFALNAGKGTQSLSFPLDKALVQQAENAARTIPVVAWGNASAVGAQHKGWNLVGQPFLSKFKGANLAGGATGTSLKYLSFPVGVNGATYTQLEKASFTAIDPFSAYFVQADADIEDNGGISFATDGRQLAPALVSPDLSDKVQIKITTATGTDNTNLVIDNTQSSAYVIGDDLEKMIGTGTPQPQVYSILGGINYAYNGLPMNSIANLPLGIYTQKSGSTTISAVTTSAPSLSKLILKDKVTGIETDLKTSNYSFTASAGTSNTRFAITAQRLSTDLELDSNENIPTVMALNGKLILKNISEKTSITLFDAVGRCVAKDVTANSTFEMKMAAQGIYTVQLQAGTKSWLKKIIIN
jgi:hypothetical protein